MRAGTESELARVVAVFGTARPHTAYLFANRRANRIKVLVHDGIGVWLAARRLNTGKFVWHERQAARAENRSLRRLVQRQVPAVSMDRHRGFHPRKAASTLLPYRWDSTLATRYREQMLHKTIRVIAEPAQYAMMSVRFLTSKTPFGGVVGAPWIVLCGMWLCLVPLALALSLLDWRLAKSWRAASSAEALAPRPANPVSGNTLDVAGVIDYVASLPQVADGDAVVRFASRLAQDQALRVLQMQTESVSTDPRKFGQTKLTLQVRGDYIHIKNLVIGLLAKFPGLTLQRLTIHHRDAVPGAPVDAGSDEAAVEMIQYLRPVDAS